jgi:hypothetical protein
MFWWEIINVYGSLKMERKAKFIAGTVLENSEEQNTFDNWRGTLI